MKKIFTTNISLVLVSASIMFTAGCRPVQPAPVEDKAKATNSPVALSLQIDNKIEVKVDSGSAGKSNTTNLTISIPPQTGDRTPLKTDLPPPILIGTPPKAIEVPNLEPKLKKWPEFNVPTGILNLAKGKKVSSSDSDPVVGTLDLITDGDKAGDDGSWVELGQGKQWVQIDLEKDAEIYAVVVWHFHSQDRVYRDVIVQVSDDPAFSKDVTTVYDNSAAGKDLPYIETNFGKIIDAKGVKGRYVRLYSSGNTTSKLNHYIEVEVFGKPAA